MIPDHQSGTGPIPSARKYPPRRLARNASLAILDAFADYHNQFKAFARRAKQRFEQRDWKGVQADSVERLDLYAKVLTPFWPRFRRIWARL